MSEFICRFRGCEVGAIGNFCNFELTIDAPSAEAARLKIYETHEHLSGLSVTQREIAPAPPAVVQPQGDGGSEAGSYAPDAFGFAPQYCPMTFHMGLDEGGGLVLRARHGGRLGLTHGELLLSAPDMLRQRDEFLERSQMSTPAQDARKALCQRVEILRTLYRDGGSKSRLLVFANDAEFDALCEVFAERAEMLEACERASVWLQCFAKMEHEKDGYGAVKLAQIEGELCRAIQRAKGGAR